MPITITEKALAEVSKVMQAQKMSTNDFALRIGILGGGCSGIQHSFGFEKKAEGDPLNDVVHKCGDLDVRTNRMADGLLSETTVDFYDDGNKRGFVFNSPKSQSGGCGGGGCGSGGCGH